MNRYLLFCGESHEGGGWTDFQLSFETIDNAISYKNDLRKAASFTYQGRDFNHIDWWHVIDFETGTQVAGNWPEHLNEL